MMLFASLISFAAGGALIWFGKEKIQALVIGTNAVVAGLEAKAAKLKAVL